MTYTLTVSSLLSRLLPGDYREPFIVLPDAMGAIPSHITPFLLIGRDSLAFQHSPSVKTKTARTVFVSASSLMLEPPLVVGKSCPLMFWYRSYLYAPFFWWGSVSLNQTPSCFMVDGRAAGNKNPLVRADGSFEHRP